MSTETTLIQRYSFGKMSRTSVPQTRPSTVDEQANMNQNDTQDHCYTGHKPVSENGTDPASPKCGDNISETVSVNESESQPVTIALADVGCDVPETATCELEIVTTGPASMVVELARKDLTYIVEQSGSRAELTGVHGDEDVGRPVQVPTWIEAMCELVGIDEVTL